MIELQIADKLVLRGKNKQELSSYISASTLSRELENAGYVIIHAGQVSLEDSAQISSSTFGTGQGGNLMMIISGTLTISGYDGKSITSGIFAGSENQTLEHAGNAGNIYIEAGQVNLSEGGHIDSATLGTGQGGNIALSTKSLHINGFHSGIYANSFGTQADAGNAGSLAIQADNITLSDSGTISTQTNHAGGGDIEIATARLLYLPQGHLITSVKGGIGNGGNITVQYPEFIVLNQGDIRAQADEGHGGNIYLAAQQFVYSIESVITASSNKGMDGEIWIDSPENALGNDLSALPAVIPLEIGLKEPCSALMNENMSRFTVAMNHGIPNLPDDLQPSYALEPVQKSNQQDQMTRGIYPATLLKLGCYKT